MSDGATAFNVDISDWNVSSVDYLYFMFYGATAFEQTLCWDLMSESRNRLYVRRFIWWSGSNAVSALLQPCIYWGAVIAAATVRKEKPDPNAYDDNEIHPISFVCLPPMYPFCTIPYDTAPRGRVDGRRDKEFDY
jgi:hypothetical protein